jgi:Ser/Thr protein kinase RdoA (MazF antagonist)
MAMAPPRRLTLELEIEQARRIVRAFDAALEPVKIDRLHGGSTEVYRIDFAGGADSIVLKIYGDDPVWAPVKEALVAGWIGDRLGAAIPRWLRIDEQRILLPLRFALMTWLPGRTVRELMAARDVEPIYRRMGAMLRHIHGVALPAYGYVGADGIMAPKLTNDAYMRAAFETAFRQFRDRSRDAELTRRLEGKAHSRFELLACSAGAVLCHDDFHQGNVLATGDAAGGLRVTGLIDFGNARAGDALFDLAKAVFCSGHEDPRSCEPLLAGYGEIDHPDPTEAIWLYTLFHRVSMWNWFTHLGDGPASSGPRGLLRDLDEMSR